MAILNQLSDFEYVAGELSAIQLDVDVLPNRSGREKKILYGKDQAVMMEHIGVRENLLSGMTMRNIYHLSSTPVGYEYPIEFQKHLSRHNINQFRPDNNKWYSFIGYKGTQSLLIDFCYSLPLIDFAWGNELSDVVEQTTGYIGGWVGSSLSLSSQQIQNMEQDMKLQQTAYTTKEYMTIQQDKVAYVDSHGEVVDAYVEDSYFAYTAVAQGNNQHGTNTMQFDTWCQISAQSDIPLRYTYPTKHITKAQLWVVIPKLDYSWTRWCTDIDDIWVTLNGFMFKVDESTNGVLTVDQSKVINKIKYAVQQQGYTIPDKDTVNPASGQKIIDHGDCYIFPKSTVKMFFVFQLDDHTKWW